jgi:hypothetical protein
MPELCHDPGTDRRYIEKVTFAEVSYRKAQMIVEYNENQVNEAQIRAEGNRLGYEVVSVSL